MSFSNLGADVDEPSRQYPTQDKDSK